MVNSILDAITKQLGNRFGTNYRYYVEDVEQGLIKPCFTIKSLNPTIRSKSPVLYDRTMPIVLHYFSDSETDLKKDCYAMSEQLTECLEYLPFKNTVLRAEDISFQIVDDVLQVFVTYGFTTRRDTADGDPMETLVETVTHSK